MLVRRAEAKGPFASVRCPEQQHEIIKSKDNNFDAIQDILKHTSTLLMSSVSLRVLGCQRGARSELDSLEKCVGLGLALEDDVQGALANGIEGVVAASDVVV